MDEVTQDKQTDIDEHQAGENFVGVVAGLSLDLEGRTSRDIEIDIHHVISSTKCWWIVQKATRLFA